MLCDHVQFAQQGNTLLHLCPAHVGVQLSTDLVRAIEPVPEDLEMDFLRISSYIGTQSSGDSTMAMQSRLPVRGRHVLVVRDLDLVMRRSFSMLPSVSSVMLICADSKVLIAVSPVSQWG